MKGTNTSTSNFWDQKNSFLKYFWQHCRTGAIREGDKIQSINNIPLRAKPLSEAISLLQCAGEVVNLKIRRELSTKLESAPPKPKLPSPAPILSSPFVPAIPTSSATVPALVSVETGVVVL